MLNVVHLAIFLGNKLIYINAALSGGFSNSESKGNICIFNSFSLIFITLLCPILKFPVLKFEFGIPCYS